MIKRFKPHITKENGKLVVHATWLCRLCNYEDYRMAINFILRKVK